jgi:hypothetical protein
LSVEYFTSRREIPKSTSPEARVDHQDITRTR